MLARRGVWVKSLAILAIPFLALAVVVAMAAKDRVDEATAASDALDGIYPFASVAGLEGALHEEGSLAIALAAGVIAPAEFEAAAAATEEARVELVDELTYHEPDTAIGATLAAVEAEMARVEQVREQLLAGTLDGPASDSYRDVLVTTKAATQATMAVLFSPTIGAVPLAHLDAARSASGEAVFESTASIFEASGSGATAAALERVDAANTLLQQTASPELADAVGAALASADATLAAEGTAMIANGEMPDLFAWADATPAWVLAYGEPEGAEIEASIGIMESAATAAEEGARRFIIIGATLWAGLLFLTMLVGRSILDPRTATGGRRAQPAPLTARKAARTTA